VGRASFPFRPAAYAWLFILLAALCFADYSDVLLVINNNSTDSISIGNYFIANRLNLTHVINITTDNTSAFLPFGAINSSIYTPIRNYLNSTADTINFVVLSTGLVISQ
jgi:hypothetical protein